MYVHIVKLPRPLLPDEFKEPSDAHDEKYFGANFEVVLLAPGMAGQLALGLPPSLPQLQHGGHKERQVGQLENP
jgi:hypothetical protein